MKIDKVSLKNFKAIQDTQIDLSAFTTIVGANGSGKSSVLQALHWMFQSGRNLSVDTNRERRNGSTLSERDATYMPSPEYKNSSHSGEYGNRHGSPQLAVKVWATTTDGQSAEADMWIKSARNEGLSVHVPSNNRFVAMLRNPAQEFSAYIPGLAGIPLQEEKKSKLLVHRQAAAGDANTVLRNVLLLLKETETDDGNALSVVERFVSSVMGDMILRVEFDEEKHTSIQASFQTKRMRDADPKRFKPLELAGIGFLQVIQIFSYLDQMSVLWRAQCP